MPAGALGLGLDGAEGVDTDEEAGAETDGALAVVFSGAPEDPEDPVVTDEHDARLIASVITAADTQNFMAFSPFALLNNSLMRTTDPTLEGGTGGRPSNRWLS